MPIKFQKTADNFWKSRLLTGAVGYIRVRVFIASGIMYNSLSKFFTLYCSGRAVTYSSPENFAFYFNWKRFIISVICFYIIQFTVNLAPKVLFKFCSVFEVILEFMPKCRFLNAGHYEYRFFFQKEFFWEDTVLSFQGYFLTTVMSEGSTLPSPVASSAANETNKIVFTIEEQVR